MHPIAVGLIAGAIFWIGWSLVAWLLRVTHPLQHANNSKQSGFQQPERVITVSDPGPEPFRTPEQITTLRSMPYDRYGQTDWWNWRRDKYWWDLGLSLGYSHGIKRCMFWDKCPPPYHVHHNGIDAYNHRGQEKHHHLLGLCDNHHTGGHKVLVRLGLSRPQRYSRRRG
jgi:hypothetical protein